MILELFLFLLTIYFVSKIFKSKGNFPPGPFGLPFIGTIPYIYVKDCLEARKKYGDLFMTKTGVIDTLYICDYKLAKETFSKSEFADRPLYKAFILFKDERKEQKLTGIIFSNGTHWVHNRRFLLRHLRDLGMGKSKIEGIIMREVEDLVEDFKKLTKEPSKLPFSINVAVLNIIWQLVASQRYAFDNKSVKIVLDMFFEFQGYLITTILPDFFPFIEYILPKPFLNYITRRTKVYKMCEEFQNHIQPSIDDHLKTLDVNNSRDLMDDYLIEMKEKYNSDYSHFSTTDLIRITFDLFTAGSDTTANMTRWFLIYMARFQEIQDKIQKEIDQVVPRDTLPGLQHRDKLAYLDATINEVQRHSSMLPFGVIRYATTDVKIGGYDIPKGTAVMSLAALSHKDPKYWKNPEEFDPSRFLDDEGKFFSTCDGFQPFGIGKRQCIGEQFARMELYIITAGLLQNFTFGPPDGERKISLDPEPVPNFQIPPKDQKFTIKYRK